MHRCLLILEVISEICLYLSDQDSHRSLASLAQTCHALQDPALDHLWRTLVGFAPLVKCLPNDMWIEVDKGSGTKSLTISRPLRSAEWTRFRTYARRVHGLVHHDKIDPDSYTHIHSSVFIALGSPVIPGPLFPELRCLVWNDIENEEAFRFLNVALGEKTQVVQIALPDPNKNSTSSTYSYSTKRPTITPALRFLPSIARCAQLEVLELGYPRFTSQDNPYSDATTELVLQLQSLDDLSCGSLNEDALVHLGRLPSLTSLSFTLPAGNVAERLMGQNMFPNLDSVDIQSGSSLDEACAFLAVLAKRPKSLTFTVPKLIHHMLRKLINQLAPGDVDESGSSKSDEIQANTHTELTFDAYTIVIDRNFPAVIPLEEEALRLSDLAPLFKFRSLEHLEIEDWMAIVLSDSDLGELAAAWPNIITLSICGKYGWPAEPQVTFAGVLSVLRLCPKLEALGIVFDARKTEGLFRATNNDDSALESGSGAHQGQGYTRPGAGVCNTSVETLLLGNSPIDDAKRIAAILSDVAPNVKSINSWDETAHGNVHDASRMRAMWKTAEEWISTFASIRKEERAWKALEGPQLPTS
ncbi:hypothetical protein CONPUDRAFT_167198 [Coniophora puteana RWD-64-598 SS2]|uniref:F-box domain-containing protein n=1 Tax=Coniophora puteana (strain RWD-64-598) TaxID=741705 RepID=A0A5M3MG32_CONPW|nr:uncharacterized protein CONPUDRAFT_167198 [Coniophora puteana RWD-64-598 SS2]EIW78123.1 hypothetical protein CONPUDRAFT_167198 [Coniophora puteana RWD-64-598 SS2]